MWIMVVLFILNGTSYFSADDDAVYETQAACKVQLEKLEKVTGLPEGATEVEVKCIPSDHGGGGHYKENPV